MSATLDRLATARLDLYANTDTMRPLLQRHLPGFADGRLRIDALRVCKARRNTSRHRNPSPMTLCYELQVSDLTRGCAGIQMLYAKVFRAGLAESIYRKQDRSQLAPPPFGDALVHLAELNMIIWALPNDPGLPQLVRLLDPTQATNVLPWAALDVPRTECGSVHVELLRYEPECRATLRYTLTRNDDAHAQTLYAKTFFNNRAQETHHRFEHFWQRAQTDAEAPLVAQPLGHCVATQTLWQAPAVGTPLLQVLNSRNSVALIGGVARALALLHAAPLAPAANSTPRSARYWAVETQRRQQKICRVDPALTARLANVVDAIQAHAARQETRSLSLIHGDFHPEQIWVYQGRIVLFDFDEFTLGDPMEDLALFLLKLEQTGASPDLTRSLVERYAASAASRFDQHSLNWHLTVQSLVQVSRAFIFQQPGWADELERRLARSEARAATLNKEAAS